MPDSLLILRALRTLDAASLATVLSARHVPTRGMNEPLDVADWLTQPQNIESALLQLPLTELRQLRMHDPAAITRAGSTLLAIAASGGSPVEMLPSTETVLRELLPEIPVASSELDEAAGALAAHDAATLAGDLLWLFEHAPVQVKHERSGSKIRGTDLRRFAATLEQDPQLVTLLGRLMQRRGLLVPGIDHWQLSETGREFLRAERAARWQELAAAWLDALDPGAYLALASGGAHEDAFAEFLGLQQRDPETDETVLTRLGACILNLESQETAALLAKHLPAAIDQVYAQPDQTIISPGPLRSEDDLDLRDFTELEHRALASQYRVTEASIMRALASGRTAADIRATLERLSLTGVPQPTQYLLDHCAERFGKVRVRAHETGTRVRAATARIHDAIRVDTALSAIKMTETTSPAGDREFATLVAPATALAALVEARYPAVLETTEGELAEHDEPASAPADEPLPDAIVELATALKEMLAGAPEEEEKTWMRRKLELARRARQWVEIDVEVPRSARVTLTVQPLAVTDQRLRALDTDADVERTVPLRSIVEVRDVVFDVEDETGSTSGPASEQP